MGTPDPEQLIDPSVRKLSSLIKSEKLPAEELAKPCSLKWPQTVPQELSLFIESLSLAALAQVLEKAPDLYWHPYVYRQLTYLRRLRCDAGAWERLGWEWEVDEESGEPAPPSGSRRRVRGVGAAGGGACAWAPPRQAAHPGPRIQEAGTESRVREPRSGWALGRVGRGGNTR
jgi:hypothetical protein